MQARNGLVTNPFNLHGSLKKENILKGGPGQGKLLNFLARARRRNYWVISLAVVEASIPSTVNLPGPRNWGLTRTPEIPRFLVSDKPQVSLPSPHGLMLLRFRSCKIAFENLFQ